jgi:conjugative transfer signal peptidase TraF
MTAQSTRRRTLLISALSVMAVSTASFVTPSYQLRYNASASAPLGWYLIVPPQDLPVGVFVLARLPTAAAALADQRHYLPQGVPILKRVAAMRGEAVCAVADGITIDQVLVARTLVQDSKGRPLQRWTGCRRLASDEFFLLNTDNVASFDSRYFGPLRRADVIGKASPLWTW